MQYGLWRLLSQRKRNEKESRKFHFGEHHDACFCGKDCPSDDVGRERVSKGSEGVYQIISDSIEVCLVDSFDPHFSMIHT